MILNEEEVLDIIMDYVSEQEEKRGFDIEFGKYEENQVQKIYDRIKYSDMFKDKTYDELYSTIQFIASGVNMGEKEEETVNTLLDATGTSSFNTFLGAGESDKINNAIEDNGLPTDLFRGMQWMSDHHKHNIMTNAGLVDIDYHVDENQNTSPVPESLVVKLNGNIIYEWHNTSGDIDAYWKNKQIVKISDIKWLPSQDKEYNKLKDIEEVKFQSYKYSLNDIVRDVKRDHTLKEQVILSNGQTRWIDLKTKRFTKAPKDVFNFDEYLKGE